MSHLSDGTIVAIRDGALVAGDARIHAMECPVCAEALEDAGRRAAAIESALSLTSAAVAVDDAKARVRARLDARRAGERPRRRFSLPLGRAAGLILLAGGAVYAMPGSPVRDWVGEIGVGARVDPLPASTSQEWSRAGSIEVQIPDEGIHIGLRSVTPGTVVQLLWLDDPIARITAAEGSSYSFAEGRAVAMVAPGPVRIEIFRDTPTVSLEVNGRMVFQGSASTPSLLESVGVRESDRVVFTF
jgi:hypothetical protein